MWISDEFQQKSSFFCSSQQGFPCHGSFGKVKLCIFFRIANRLCWTSFLNRRRVISFKVTGNNLFYERTLLQSEVYFHNVFRKVLNRNKTNKYQFQPLKSAETGGSFVKKNKSNTQETTQFLQRILKSEVKHTQFHAKSYHDPLRRFVLKWNLKHKTPPLRGKSTSDCGTFEDARAQRTEPLFHRLGKQCQ